MGAAMWLFNMFMGIPVSAVLDVHTSSRLKRKRRQSEGMPATYCGVLKYLLSIYDADDSIAETDAEMTFSKQPLSTNLVDYSYSLRLNALKCGLVYDEAVFEGLFIEGLHGLIRHSTCAYWKSHRKATSQEFLCYATSLTSLQPGPASPGTTSTPW